MKSEKLHIDEGEVEQKSKEVESPTKILEEDKEPQYEAGLVKVRGGKLMDYREKKSGSSSSLSPEFKAKHIGDKPYSILHTHPRLERETEVTNPEVLVEPEYRPFFKLTPQNIEQMRADVSPSFPSDEDLISVLMYKNNVSTRIAQRDPVTGKVAGYFIVMKTKDTPSVPPVPEGDVTDEQMAAWYELPEVKKAYGLLGTLGYYISPAEGGKLTPDQLVSNEEALRKFCDEYKLLVRMVSNKGYTYKKGLGFLKI